MSDAERARAIVGSGGLATLCTLARDPAGYPFGSMVSYALDAWGAPLLLISRLAEHTANALADPRASLLVAEPAPPGEDPLAYGRVTLLGRLTETERDATDAHAVREAFIAAHPAAELYVDFADFAFFRLAIEGVRYVGGFGKMSWVEAAEFSTR